MQSNRSRDTGPEVALRSELHRLGLRFRVATRPMPSVRRTVDVVFSRVQVAVFLDGCYWHGCPEHHRLPVLNRDYWLAKVRRNRDRDAATDELLGAASWHVIRVWEHEDPKIAAIHIASVVRERRARTSDSYGVALWG
jgi:DNA mismatch endonuclease (patch repair protein)